MEVKGMIEYTNKMLDDKELTNEQKVELLETWEGKLQNKISQTILSSDELKELNTVIEHLKICNVWVSSL
jgi:hypothetical protein